MNADRLVEWLAEYGADVAGIKDRFMDDMALYAHCLNAYVKEDMFAQLDDAMAQSDIHAAFIAAHTLKGVSANMGLLPMNAAINELVEALRANQDGKAEYERFLQQLSTIKAFVDS